VGPVDQWCVIDEGTNQHDCNGIGSAPNILRLMVQPIPYSPPYILVNLTTNK